MQARWAHSMKMARCAERLKFARPMMPQRAGLDANEESELLLTWAATFICICVAALQRTLV